MGNSGTRLSLTLSSTTSRSELAREWGSLYVEASLLAKLFGAARDIRLQAGSYKASVFSRSDENICFTAIEIPHPSPI